MSERNSGDADEGQNPQIVSPVYPLVFVAEGTGLLRGFTQDEWIRTNKTVNVQEVR